MPSLSRRSFLTHAATTAVVVALPLPPRFIINDDFERLRSSTLRFLDGFHYSIEPYLTHANKIGKMFEVSQRQAAMHEFRRVGRMTFDTFDTAQKLLPAPKTQESVPAIVAPIPA